jgi:nitrite reductase/ring-hydroxylating ferredoxin subunit
VRIVVEGAGRLRPGEARRFDFERDGEHIEGFVLAVESAAFRGTVAFRNRCAHVGFDLDMGTGVFWSSRVERIYCRTHGACFRPEDGICDAGPCLGLALERYAVEIVGDDAIVDVDFP